MKLYAYHYDNGEIKQAEIEVEELLVLVPKNYGASLPFVCEEGIEYKKLGRLFGDDADTIFYTEPSFYDAKEKFSDVAKKAFMLIENGYKRNKAELEKLEKQEEPHGN